VETTTGEWEYLSDSRDGSLTTVSSSFGICVSPQRPTDIQTLDRPTRPSVYFLIRPSIAPTHHDALVPSMRLLSPQPTVTCSLYAEIRRSTLFALQPCSLNLSLLHPPWRRNKSVCFLLLRVRHNQSTHPRSCLGRIRTRACSFRAFTSEPVSVRMVNTLLVEVVEEVSCAGM
jgi:hypothetical protein